MTISYQTVLNFWFKTHGPVQWFKKDDAFDQLIKDMFLKSYHAARVGQYHDWMNAPDSLLALILLLDQFPRNMFRDDKMMYQADPLACYLTYIAIEKGFDQKIDQDKRLFIYLPLMHSEQLEDQIKSVEMFKKMGNQNSIDYAIQHYDIVKKFAHFPHRNQTLSRLSTDEELEFLKQPGSSF